MACDFEMRLESSRFRHKASYLPCVLFWQAERISRLLKKIILVAGMKPGIHRSLYFARAQCRRAMPMICRSDCFNNNDSHDNEHRILRRRRRFHACGMQLPIIMCALFPCSGIILCIAMALLSISMRVDFNEDERGMTAPLSVPNESP